MKMNAEKPNERTKKGQPATVLCLLLLLHVNAWTLDSDGDFMPDRWEVQCGLDPGNAEDALFDPDNDAFANLCEYPRP